MQKNWYKQCILHKILRHRRKRELMNNVVAVKRRRIITPDVAQRNFNNK